MQKEKENISDRELLSKHESFRCCISQYLLKESEKKIFVKASFYQKISSGNFDNCPRWKHLYCHHQVNYRPRNFLAVLKPRKISVFGSFSWGNSKPSRMPSRNLGRNERVNQHKTSINCNIGDNLKESSFQILRPILHCFRQEVTASRS